jgi:hypothetical protein
LEVGGKKSQKEIKLCDEDYKIVSSDRVILADVKNGMQVRTLLCILWLFLFYDLFCLFVLSFVCFFKHMYQLMLRVHGPKNLDLISAAPPNVPDPNAAIGWTPQKV